MKKLFVSILILFFVKDVFGQTYPVGQNLGRTPSTLVSTNSLRADQGLIFGIFTDTTAANALPYLKNYPGACIATSSDASLWLRDVVNAQFWSKIGGTAAGGASANWLVGGQRFTNQSSLVDFVKVIGTWDSLSLGLMADSTIQLKIPRFGINESSDASNKVLTFNPTTKYMYWTSGGGGGCSTCWDINGNASTVAGTNFLGTTDDVSLSIKVDNENAGFIKSNPSTQLTIPNGGLTTFGMYAGDTIIKRVLSGYALGTNQTLIGNKAGYSIGSLADSNLAASDENTFIGMGVGYWTQHVSTSYAKGRNTAVGAFSLFRNISGSYNQALGNFALELNNKGDANSAFGNGALRSNIDGDFNAAFGGSSLLYNSTGIASATASGGTGYVTGDTVYFSLPYLNGPGTCYAAGYGIITASAGAATAVTIISPGCGYSSKGGTFAPGYKHPPVTVDHVSGSGTGATIVATLASGSRNAAAGILAGESNVIGSDNAYLGYSSGNSGVGNRPFDNKMLFLGANTSVLSSVPSATTLTNAGAIGYGSRVSQSSTIAVGDSATYSLKLVLNGTFTDSTFKVNGGTDITGGLRLRSIGSGFLPVASTGGSIVQSRINQYALGVGGLGVDDLTTGVTTTNPYLLVLRNAYAGDGSATQAPMMLLSTSASSSTQKNFIGALAGSMPTSSTFGWYFGRSASSKNSYYQNFYYAGSGSDGNYMEEQFYGVTNVSRTYANKHKTIGNITSDNGYSLEVDSAVKFNQYIDIPNISAPSSPSSGVGRMYSRSDSLRYKNSAGTEFTLGLGGSGANIYNTDGTLTGDRVLSGNGNSLTFDDLDDFVTVGAKNKFYSTDSAYIRSGSSESVKSSIALYGTGIVLSKTNASHTSSIKMLNDTITLEPPLGKLFVDTLTNVPGTKALRYNPTTGLVSYADTTAAGGGVSGPGSSTDYALAAWNGAGGNTLRNTLVTTDASGNLYVPSTQSLYFNGYSYFRSTGTNLRVEVPGEFQMWRSGFNTTVSMYGASGSAAMFFVGNNSDSRIYTNGHNNLLLQPSSNNSAGLVGIGTTSPTLKLQVAGRMGSSQGADVASANNLTLGSDGNTFSITGTTQINLLDKTGWIDGSEVFLYLASGITVKHNQSTSSNNVKILIPGAADLTTTAVTKVKLQLSTVGGTQAWYMSDINSY